MNESHCTMNYGKKCPSAGGVELLLSKVALRANKSASRRRGGADFERPGAHMGQIGGVEHQGDLRKRGETSVQHGRATLPLEDKVVRSEQRGGCVYKLSMEGPRCSTSNCTRFR